MNDKNNSHTELDKAKKQKRREDGKKMVKQSLLILLLSVSSLFCAGFIEGILSWLGITVSSVIHYILLKEYLG